MRLLVLIICVICLSSCGYYLTPRPPIMERKMGSPFSETVGVLATAADYRVVYVQIKPGSQICPEPSPDVAGQFAAALAGALSASPADRPLSAEAQVQLAVSMKQLIKRSQGIQSYRDMMAVLCIARFNNWVSQQYYIEESRAIRHDAVDLISKEIPYLYLINFDPVAAPVVVPFTPVGKVPEVKKTE